MVSGREGSRFNYRLQHRAVLPCRLSYGLISQCWDLCDSGVEERLVSHEIKMTLAYLILFRLRKIKQGENTKLCMLTKTPLVAQTRKTSLSGLNPPPPKKNYWFSGTPTMSLQLARFLCLLTVLPHLLGSCLYKMQVVFFCGDSLKLLSPSLRRGEKRVLLFWSFWQKS